MPEHSFDFSTDRQLLRRLSVFYAIIKSLLFIRVCARSYDIMSIMQSAKLHDKAHQPEWSVGSFYYCLISMRCLYSSVRLFQSESLTDGIITSIHSISSAPSFLSKKTI